MATCYFVDHFFRLVLPDRTFFFFANNEEDCTQWVDLLKAIIQQVRDYSYSCVDLKFA